MFNSSSISRPQQAYPYKLKHSSSSSTDIACFETTNCIPQFKG